MARVVKVTAADSDIIVHLNAEMVVAILPMPTGSPNRERWEVRTCDPATTLQLTRENAELLLRSLGSTEPLAETKPSADGSLTATPASAAAPGQPAIGAGASFLGSSYSDGFVPFSAESFVPQTPLVTRSDGLFASPGVAPTPVPSRVLPGKLGGPRTVPSEIQEAYRDAVARHDRWVAVSQNDDVTFWDADAVSEAREEFLEALGAVGELCAQADPGVGRAVAARAESDFDQSEEDAELAGLIAWMGGED